jgi:dipeptidase E
MKKLFLTSSAAKVLPLLPGFLSTDASHMSVAFIPTAADLYEDKWFVEDDKKALLDLGFQIVLVDIKNEETAVITQKLQSADIIFVAGGNTFYLLQELQRK